MIRLKRTLDLGSLVQAILLLVIVMSAVYGVRSAAT